ncbi:MAG TPA: aryl-sulfate sulfotransferase [Bryobacteraceae bacterium]|jgi:hypothetical protein|nr:aryl-sulfate sulfotransferase [Bryobacteraceae bacterium]
MRETVRTRLLPINRSELNALLLLCSFAPLANAQFSVTLNPSVPSPAAVGTQVTWTAVVSGADPGPFWYRFSTRGQVEGHRTVRDFGPENTLGWAAGERDGSYTVEVEARSLGTGERASATSAFTALPNAVGGRPAIRPTMHPLVFLYSAPPCRMGQIMAVYYTSSGQPVQETSAKSCDGVYTMNFYVAGLRPETTYYLKHIVQGPGTVSEGPVLTFRSGQPEFALPVMTKIQPYPPTTQPVLLSGAVFSYLQATDLDGTVIWYYPEIVSFLTRPEPGGSFFAINEVQDADSSRQIVREFDLVGNILLETNAARVSEQLEAMGKRPINAFHHEARRLPDGNILLLAGVEQILTNVQGPGAVNVLGDMIIVMNRDLEVIWAWDGFDHLDPRRLATQNERCTPGVCPPLYLASQANDWMHGNSVSRTPDGNLLFSIRNQDWVVLIDYQDGKGSGQVIWRLGQDGDFRIRSDDPWPWFSHQHDPEFESNGMLSLFDNGNVRWSSDNAVNSRGQVYRLDEVNRVAELVLNSNLGYYSFALGSAQLLLNGNYFFGNGFRADGSGIGEEVNPSGDVVYSIESTAPEYRTFRMKNMYTP